jgi:PAS domain S-box-containing protein
MLQPLNNGWDDAPDQSPSRFAVMFLEAAARLIDLPTAEFEEVITQILNQLAGHLQMDFVGIITVQVNEANVPIVQRYTAGSADLPSIDELAYPWYASQLRSGGPIILPHAAQDLPPEAEAERAYLNQHNVKSIVTLPMRIGDQLVGSVYFGSVTQPFTWPAADLHALTTFARVLAGAALRKQAGDALRRSEEQLRLAVNAAGVGIWVWDLVHPENSYASDNLSSIHGITPCPREQALQVYLSSLFPEDRTALEQLAMRCLSGELAEFMVEHRILWPDGSIHWVEARGYGVRDATGQVTQLTGVMQEITERKAVEAQMEKQRQELLRQARMMEQTERVGEIGGWEWDVVSNEIYWTPELYRIFGVSPAEHIPTLDSSVSFFTPASAAILANAMRHVTLAGEGYDLKLQLVNGQGKTLWVRVSGRAEAVDGQVIRVFGSIQDITQRTEIEEQLRDAQKMEAIGQLAGGIAHDFNNLLTSINSMSELATLYLDRLAAASETKRIHNYLSEIQRAGQRAAQLTRQLLAFSRKQVLHPKVLDLRSEIARMQALLQQLLGDKIALTLMLPSQLGLVAADPSQIEQALINLVLNARDAMPDGGGLTIKLANANLDEAAARQHTEFRPGNYVMLEVEDSGHGMTPEVQARLFDPFFTTKAVGEGTGLGLATVYGIVRQSGGMIEVDSQVDVGSTFRIFLPQTSPEPQDDERPSVFARGGTETILVVEDDIWVRQMIRTALETKGYRLLDAPDRRGAISLCQNYIGDIHLLVANETTLGMSDFSLVSQAHLYRPELRVLFVVEPRDEGEMPTLSPLSEYFFLPKPLRMDLLTAKVRSLLDMPAAAPLL